MSETFTETTGTVVPKKTGLATAALVFGILSILTLCIFMNYVFAGIGLILGIVYLVKKGEKTAKGRAIAGLVCAVLSITISTLVWGGIYNYFMNTSIVDLAEDLNEATGGEFDVEAIVDESINDFMNEVGDMSSVEQLLGKELSYETICEFVGEEVTIHKLDKFVGDGISAEELETLLTNINSQAVIEDLGGEFTYKALEEKLGENFTYEDLKNYLEEFKK